MNTEILLYFISGLFVVTQIFWFWLTERLTSKLMARNYSEFKSFEMKKPKVNKAITPLEPDPEDVRIVNEANKMFGMM